VRDACGQEAFQPFTIRVTDEGRVRVRSPGSAPWWVIRWRSPKAGGRTPVTGDRGQGTGRGDSRRAAKSLRSPGAPTRRAASRPSRGCPPRQRRTGGARNGAGRAHALHQRPGRRSPFCVYQWAVPRQPERHGPLPVPPPEHRP
jgi:hypothetical protein